MSNFIKGRLYQLKDPSQFSIGIHNTYKILYIVKKILHIEIKIIKSSYKQGFINVSNYIKLDHMVLSLEFLILNVDKIIYRVKSLKELSYELIKLINNKINEEYFTLYFSKVIGIIQAKIKASIIPNKKIIIFAKNLNIYEVLSFKNNVRAIICERKTNHLIRDYLDSIYLPYIQVKNLDYEQKDIIIDVNKQILVDEIKTTVKNQIFKRKNIKLGVEINSIDRLMKINDVQIDFILIEPEKAYLKTNGIQNFDSRLKFYKSLYEKFKDKEIILILPRLDTLYNYYQLNNDFLIDDYKIMQHFELIFNEVKAFCRFSFKSFNISISNISCYEMYKKIKKTIKNIVNLYTNRPYKIGLNIETETIVEHLSKYQKYDFCVIDLDRLEVEIHSDSYKIDHFFKEVFSINQYIKHKYKDVYITGSNINNLTFFHKLLTRGFKNICGNELFFNEFDKEIDRYNASRGKYKKNKKIN